MAKLYYIKDISVNNNMTIINTYRSAGSALDFANSNELKYSLVNRSLSFNRPIQTDITLFYTFIPNIDFTKIASTDTEYFRDDLEQFHDIISMIMAKLYYIKDISVNNNLEIQLQQRMNDLAGFFSQGMDFEGSHYVQETSRNNWNR